MDKDFLAEETTNLKADDDDASERSALVVSAPDSPDQNRSAVSTTDSQEITADDKLAKHINAFKIKPLPPEHILGASAAQAFNRPMPIIGQALTIFIVVGVLAFLWMKNALIFGAIFLVGLPVVFGAVLVGAILLAVRHRLIAVVEFLAGMIHPLTIVKKEWFTAFSACGLADALQGTNEYLLAAACYGEMMRAHHPIDALHLARGAEREYILSLAYAGKFEHAFEYAISLLRQAEYYATTVKTQIALVYHCFALRTYAMALELSGASAKANEMRKQCYELTKDLSTDKEAYLLGCLCMAEAHFSQKEYAQASPLLQQFIDGIRPEHTIKTDYYLSTRASFLLSCCLAAQGDLETAGEVYKLAAERAKNDVSTYSASDNAMAHAFILRFSGSEKEADDEIDKTIKDLRISQGSVLFKVLSDCKSANSAHPDSREGRAKAFTYHAVVDGHEVDSKFEDDPPQFYPAFAEERKEQRRMMQSTFGFALLTVVFLIVYSVPPALLALNVVLMIFIGMMLRSRMANTKCGMEAVKKGKAVVLPMQISGNRDLSIFKEEKELYYYSSNPRLWEKLQFLAGNDIIDAVAYEDETGEISAVQVLGYFASVSRAKK